MKKFLVAGFIILFAAFSYAQECSNYYFMQDKKTIEMTIYNKKGDPNGRQVYNVNGVSNSGGTTTATVNSEMFDKKGKSVAKSSGTYECKGGVVMVNMKTVIPSAQMEQFGKADVKADDVYIEYPAGMKVGDALKDASFNMEMDQGGLKQTLIYVVNNRKVEGKESVTTTAGTWDCFKISFKAKLTIKTAGIGIPMNIEGTEWYAPDFGIVKTETKQGGTAITSIK